MKILSTAELHNLILEINEKDPDNLKSTAVLEYWDSLPDTLVLQSSDTLEFLLQSQGVPCPEQFDFALHKPEFDQLCGFNTWREPKSFQYGGNGDLYWLIKFETKGHTLKQFLTNWVNQAHEQTEADKAFQG